MNLDFAHLKDRFQQSLGSVFAYLILRLSQCYHGICAMPKRGQQTCMPSQYITQYIPALCRTVLGFWLLVLYSSFALTSKQANNLGRKRISHKDQKKTCEPRGSTMCKRTFWAGQLGAYKLKDLFWNADTRLTVPLPPQAAFGHPLQSVPGASAETGPTDLLHSSDLFGSIPSSGISTEWCHLTRTV